MNRIRFIWGILIFFLVIINNCARVEKFDTLITGGKLIDGTGNPWRYADVGIIGDKIAKVGKLSGSEADKKISAEGLYVVPGFIDMHTHSDYTLLVDGTAQSKVRQGVTLEVIGESESAGPVFGEAVKSMERGLERLGLKLTWKTLGEYFKVLENSGISVNIASYVGLGGVRSCVMGKENRKPTGEEMEEMKRLVRVEMEDGAIGISSGLIYVPDMFFTTEEIIELAKISSEYKGIYGTHIRSEDGELLESIDEAVRIGREANMPVDIFHFKSDQKKYWYKMPEAIKKINNNRCW